MNGRRETMGRMMSETRELATEENDAARLCICVNGCHERLLWVLHEADCNFQDIISERKVGEVIPSPGPSHADIAFKILEAWHPSRIAVEVFPPE
jgi:hypothetical protein